jgi:hypothetical protein
MPQRPESRAISRQALRDRDVVIDIFRNELCDAGGRQQARADAPGMPVAMQGYDRDTHPKRFAGCRGAIVWKRVESDIDAIIGGKMFRLRAGMSPHRYALWIDAFRLELRSNAIANGAIAKLPRFEQQACIWNRRQQARPKSNDGPIDFIQVIERPEGDLSRGANRRRIHCWVVIKR